MKQTILFSSIALACGLLFVNIYSSMVDAPAWGADIDHSMATVKQYYSVKDPGHFFRLFSPLNQVISLLVLILFWKSGRQTRWLLLSAFLVYVATDILTFAYFYPRNDIMFFSEQYNPELIRNAWKEWSSMNWLRSLMVMSGVVFSFAALKSLLHKDLRVKADLA